MLQLRGTIRQLVSPWWYRKNSRGSVVVRHIRTSNFERVEGVRVREVVQHLNCCELGRFNHDKSGNYEPLEA